MLSNVVSYLTDCPTREKIGWLEQTCLNADAVLPNIDAPDCYCGVKGAAVAYHSMFGRIASDWAMEAGRWRLNVEVPAGKSAVPLLSDCRTEAIRQVRGARRCLRHDTFPRRKQCRNK